MQAQHAQRGDAVRGVAGVVSAGSPQAAEAGAAVLAQGGTAADAAIAASAVQCVVEFAWCGLGGDAFLLIRPPGGAVVAVNGSGAAPARAADGLDGVEWVPRFGPRSVAVPGLVAAWELVHSRFGSMPLTQLMEPAIAIASHGFDPDPRLSAAMTAAAADAIDSPGLTTLLSRRDGPRFTEPELAGTLAEIGAGGAEYFYRGPFAHRMAEHLRARGGVMTRDDLAAHTTAWSPPLRIDYRGHAIYENPPVSLGSVLLQELLIFEQCSSTGLEPGSAELIDLMVRCKIAAFADTYSAVDGADVSTRLSADRASWWRDRLAGLPDRSASYAVSGGPDTTCLAVRDQAGLTVTMIHSLFNTFGSREVVDGTGVILNDRLASLAVPGTPTGQGPRLQPGHRPLHTLNSYLVVRGDDVVIAGATPGGRGQVQTNFQVLVNLIDKDMTPLAAVCAPRWMHGTPRSRIDDGVLHLEAGLGAQVAGRLSALGHDVRINDEATERNNDFFGSCTAVGSAVDGAYAVADGRRGAAVRRVSGTHTGEEEQCPS